MSGHQQNHREGAAVHEMIMSVRCDMEATMALFIAVAMGVLGRIAHSGWVAPWREQLTSAMPVASLASLRQHSVRVFCSSPARAVATLTMRSRFLHGSGLLPCRNPVGYQWAGRRRRGELQNHRARRLRNVTILLSGIGQVEIAPPTAAKN